ncbi:hypothetical protein E2C01_062460 [Portunus trituberculatus]|uniref:Uncharacterized protein n=1 Tax=Portunus trituberculatus TaxID=210409 RepID=A0A5B7HB60_PORTR|nr:hypothetical protein [Portunus trituberculatus]
MRVRVSCEGVLCRGCGTAWWLGRALLCSASDVPKGIVCRSRTTRFAVVCSPSPRNISSRGSPAPFPFPPPQLLLWL